MEKVSVSIIIPVYKTEEYIEKCINSVLKQTLKNIEIIFIDDCGNDNSIKIVERYKENDNRIKIHYNEKNLGTAISRNNGIEAAVGEYIAFLDPDDWVDKNFYERLYIKAKKNNLDIVKAERKAVFASNKIDKSSYNKNIAEGLKKGRSLACVFTREFTTAIYKRNLVIENNIKFPELSYSEDTIFLIQATQFAKKFDTCNGTFYHYLQREKSAVRNLDVNRFKSLTIWSRYCCEFINNFTCDKDSYIMLFEQIFSALVGNYSILRTDKTLKDYKKEYLENLIDIYDSCKYKESIQKRTYQELFDALEQKNVLVLENTLEKYIIKEHLTNNGIKFLIKKLESYIKIKLKK